MVKTIKFKDYPEFCPNITPKEIFIKGSFGGTYWRSIYSNVTKKHHKNRHVKFKWVKDIPKDKLIKEFKDYDKNINKYKVKVGTTLRFWENKKWIKEQDPYGWVEWYANFYDGRRSKDDERQIKRWKQLTGPNGRFKIWLINLIKKKNGKYNDYTISPKIRQTLLHWGYEITKNDIILKE